KRGVGAPEPAPSAVVACRPPCVGRGHDRLLGRPPIPSELLVPIPQQLARPSQGRRRQWQGISLWTTWISGKPCDSGDGLIDGVVGREVLVGQRPVDTDAVETPHAKVRRRQSPVVA